MNRRSSNRNLNRRSERGHTLIELMVAITIGLFLVSSVAGTYVWSSRNLRQDDATARMQESARSALDAIGTDLLMAGFTHDALSSAGIDTILVKDKIVNDCGPSADNWTIALSDPIEFQISKGTSVIKDAYKCINNDLYTVKDSNGNEISSAISIKRGRQHQGAMDSDDMYLQTSIEGASRLIIADHSDNPDPDPEEATYSTAATWDYLVNIYYIEKSTADTSVPVLYRSSLSGTKYFKEAGGIAEGIEYFHVMWGIDNNMIDGNPTTYPLGQPKMFVSSVGTDQLPGVIAAKVFVLVKSRNIDVTHTDDKSYTLGDVTLPAINDHYRRKVFSSTFKLRNLIIGNTVLALTEALIP